MSRKVKTCDQLDTSLQVSKKVKLMIDFFFFRKGKRKATLLCFSCRFPPFFHGMEKERHVLFFLLLFLVVFNSKYIFRLIGSELQRFSSSLFFFLETFTKVFFTSIRWRLSKVFFLYFFETFVNQSSMNLQMKDRL